MKSKAKSVTPQTQLDARLDAYSVSARGWRAGFGNWPVYGAATAAALAGATSASASIIYTPVNTTISAGSGLSHVVSSSASRKLRTGKEAPLAFLNGPLPSIGPEILGEVTRTGRQLSVHSFDIGVKSNSTGGAVLGAAGGIMGTRFASALNKGAMISGGKNFTQIGVLRERIFQNTSLHGLIPKTQFNATTKGNFVPGQTFFAGLQLDAAFGSVTKTGHTTYGSAFTYKSHPVTAFDYGWLQLRVDNLAGLPVNLTILDYAYDDSGNPILAGDTGQQSDSTTPEPSTAAMLLLAAGAAGVTAWKRQRKASA